MNPPGQSLASAARGDAAPFDRLFRWLPRIPVIVQRAPPPDAAERWRTHGIGGVEHRVAQPVTFTPYAAVQPCSARCTFCSENLRVQNAGRAAATLRPGADYFANLEGALDELTGLPLGYSLSGLEMTDDLSWFQQLAMRLRDHAQRSPVSETVLYTNGAGLADPERRDGVLQSLAGLPNTSIEWSRHHFESQANQKIMRFRPGIGVAASEPLQEAVREARAITPVKFVCVIQGGGIDTAPLLLQYLAWARSLGVGTVIFRELSRLDDSYLANATWRYIENARRPMLDLLASCLAHPDFRAKFAADHATQGYYFWNLCGQFEGMNLVFEASDYSQMHARHRSGRVYKLVFHANGNLCAGWNPERDVLRAASTPRAS